MHVLVWIVAASVSVVLGQSNDDTELLLVQILFRHGARAPIIPYPNDPNPPESWPEGFGALTQLGKRQQYVLGKFLRSFYSGFVTSNPNEIKVNSTEYDRTQRSALANLASFYAPTDEWRIDEDLQWQPIPVTYINSQKDRYLDMGSECPRFFEEQETMYNSSEFLAVIAQHEDMIEAVKKNSGVPDWMWATLLQDTVISEKAHGLIVPEWLDPYWDELTEFSEFTFFWLFNSDIQKRLRAGPILQKIIENMDNKIAGKNSHLKVHMFSAHDANLLALFEALDLYSHRPPFCATLLVELHQVLDGEKAVRLVYLNSSTPEDIETHRPRVLQLQGCGEFCPLEDFRQLTGHLIPKDWDAECQTTSDLYKNMDGSLMFGSLTNPTATTICSPSSSSNEIGCRTD